MSKFIKYFGALFMEKGKTDGWRISIGRTSWWVIALPALYIWMNSMGKDDIASGHLTVLIALTTYNFTKKIVDTANNVWGKKENEPEQ